MSSMAAGFSPWQQRAYAQAADALDSGRLGHALLVCGPAHLGKRAVMERLAQRALCRTRDTNGDACGQCRSCQLFAAGTNPDYGVVSFVMNKEGTRLRTEVVIDQIRDLSAQFALTPQYGGARIAIIDPADAVNHAACNALLKTLEEPQAGRYLWLVTADPARLPATIRSRCQKLEFRLPPPEESIRWLRGNGHDEQAIVEALDASRGHPGLADLWLRDGSLRLRKEVVGDLAQLSRADASPLDVGQRWAGDDRADLRLRFAADHALALAAGLTEPGRTRTLATWFDAANRTRTLLRTTVRSDLAIAELLLAWQGASASRAAASGRN
jgi:DNA polymerase-3 subunit delta'